MRDISGEFFIFKQESASVLYTELARKAAFWNGRQSLSLHQTCAACGRLMSSPSQQHLYNGLAGTVDCYSFHRNGLACLRASPCWHRNGLSLTDSLLAYGHHG